MENCAERTYKKGEVIYSQNDYETCLYDILYGSVALYQNYGTQDETLVKEQNAGSYFGEIELIEARPRTTTAVALEKTAVKVITAESFGTYFQEKPAVVMSIMQQMSARIRELTRLYQEACRVTAESVEAEATGQKKSDELEQKRKELTAIYHSYSLFSDKDRKEK